MASTLDASVPAVSALPEDLRQRLNLSGLLISRYLGVVASIDDHIAVLEQAQIHEQGDSGEALARTNNDNDRPRRAAR